MAVSAEVWSQWQSLPPGQLKPKLKSAAPGPGPSTRVLDLGPPVRPTPPCDQENAGASLSRAPALRDLHNALWGQLGAIWGCCAKRGSAHRRRRTSAVGQGPGMSEMNGPLRGQESGEAGLEEPSNEGCQAEELAVGSPWRLLRGKRPHRWRVSEVPPLQWAGRRAAGQAEDAAELREVLRRADAPHVPRGAQHRAPWKPRHLEEKNGPPLVHMALDC